MARYMAATWIAWKQLSSFKGDGKAIDEEQESVSVAAQAGGCPSLKCMALKPTSSCVSSRRLSSFKYRFITGDTG